MRTYMVTDLKKIIKTIDYYFSLFKPFAILIKNLIPSVPVRHGDLIILFAIQISECKPSFCHFVCHFSLCFKVSFFS